MGVANAVREQAARVKLLDHIATASTASANARKMKMLVLNVQIAQMDIVVCTFQCVHVLLN